MQVKATLWGSRPPNGGQGHPMGAKATPWCSGPPNGGQGHPMGAKATQRRSRPPNRGQGHPTEVKATPWVPGPPDGCRGQAAAPWGELEPRPQVEAHEDDVNAVALGDAGGQLLLSGGDDGVCRAWDRRCLGEGRPRPVGLLTGHRDGITFLHPRVRRWEGLGATGRN